MVPDEGRLSPKSNSINVLLPIPFFPLMQYIIPGLKVKEKFEIITLLSKPKLILSTVIEEMFLQLFLDCCYENTLTN